jgi:cyclin H
VYLATRSENHYISLENYVKNIPKLEGSTVRELELIVLDALRFHLACHHPYIALHGLFLDCQTMDAAKSIGTDFKWLQSIYDRSIQLAHDSLYTDLCFVYQPSQIAVALFTMAAEELLPEGFDFQKSYLAVRHADNPLLPILLDIIKSIINVMRTELQLPTSKEYKDAAGKIDKRLALWRNPLMDPQSEL